MTPAEHVAVALVVLAAYLWLAAWVHDRRNQTPEGEATGAAVAADRGDTARRLPLPPAAEVAYLEHVAEALVLAEKEQAVIHDRIVCERIEREEWRHG